MTPKRRRRLLFALALLAVAAFAVRRVPHWTARRLEQGLSAFFQRPASVAAVRVGLFPLEIEVLDLRVAGATPQAQPFLEVPRAVATPALLALWQRRLVLARLRVESPKIRVNAYGERGDDIPRLGGGDGSSMDIRVRRLVVEAGEVQLSHQRIPLELDLPNVRGRLASRSVGTIAGTVSFGPGRLRFGDAPEMSLATDMEVHLEGPLLTVETGHLRAGTTDLVYEGELRIADRLRGEFTLKGPLDLAFLDERVVRSGLGIKGRARWEGRALIESSGLRFQGSLEGQDGSFNGIAVPSFRSQVGWDAKGLHLRNLEVAALGGTGALDIDVPPGSGTASLRGALRETDVEASSRWIFGLGPMGVGSAATGEVVLSWPRGHINRVTGRLALDLLARTDGRTPLWGRFEWRAQEGAQTIERADLHTAETAARLLGRVEADQRADLGIDAESRDLASADELLTRLRLSLGTADAQRTGVGGRGEFHGRWLGTLRAPVFEGRFDGEDVSYLGVDWGRAHWTGSATPMELRTSALELQRNDAQIRVSGNQELGDYGDHDALDLRVRAVSWPAEDLVKALGQKIDVSGPVSAEATLLGRRSSPRGDVRVAVRGGRYYGTAFADLELQAKLRERAVEIRSGRASLGGGTLVFRGARSDDGVYDASAEAQGVEMQELLRGASIDAPLAGRVSGRLTLQGTLERPRLAGDIASQHVFFGDEGVGALQASLKGRGDGKVQVDLHCRSPRVQMALRGAVALRAEEPSELHLALTESSIDPFLRVLYPSLSPAVTMVITGEGDLSGPLRSLPDLRATASVSEFRVNLPEYPVTNRETLRFRLEQSVVQVEHLSLAGEGTDLAITGSAGMAGQAPLNISVSGAADLRALSVVSRSLRGLGAARLAMGIRGTVEAPRVDGTLELSGGGLRIRGFPTGIEALKGRVRFNEKGAQLEEVSGRFGGGDVEVAGQTNFSGGRLSSVDIQLNGRAVNVRYPEGLRSQLDLDLRLFGDDQKQWLAGTIDVRHALWTKRYDLASELLSGSTIRPEGAPTGEGVRLDLKVRAPGTLEVDNNLATLRARAELNVAGSSEAPVLLGRAEIDRGRIYFQGNTYTIRRGTIDFANPHRTDPEFNVEAETRIRSYRVTLKVNGTLQRVYPTLTSDPPLSAVQIVNLMAGADETAVASLTQSQSDQAKLAVAGAATLFTGALSEQVGLGREAERLFGLNRFSIDPSLVKGDVSSPTARLTVGKRITPDLSMLYSIDLKNGRDQLLSVEYTLSDRFSVLFTSSEPSGMGIDVRIRQSR